MQWGLTRSQRKAKFQRKMEDLSIKRPHFAWTPVKLLDGRWVWLEYVARYRVCWTASGYAYECSSGWWAYESMEEAFGVTWRKMVD